MIVRSEDFEARHPEWLKDEEIPEELKRCLEASGMGEPTNSVECLEIVDECFKCGGKLTTPYVYWNGAAGSISLHPACAARLSLGLAQDSHELAAGTRCKIAAEAAEWLRSVAQNDEHGRDA